jgi:EpsI family protein
MAKSGGLILCALFAAALWLQSLGRLASSPVKGGAELSRIPARFGGWRSEEHKLDAVSARLLEPDAVLWRTYVDPEGRPLDFLVVYGHRKKSFHSPGFCLPGSGWEVAAKERLTLKIPGAPGGSVEANLFRIQNKGVQQLALYWFAHGRTTTPSLFQHNLNLLKSRLMHRRAFGALVRVVVPVVTTEQDALRRAVVFLREVYPEVNRQISS